MLISISKTKRELEFFIKESIENTIYDAMDSENSAGCIKDRLQNNNKDITAIKKMPL